MVIVQKFMFEEMFGVFWCGLVVFNLKGIFVLYIVFMYFFEEGKIVKEGCVMDLIVVYGKIEQFWEDDKIGEVVWVFGMDSQVLYFKFLEEEGFMQVKVVDVVDVIKEYVFVKEIKVFISFFRFKDFGDGGIVFVVVG